MCTKPRGLPFSALSRRIEVEIESALSLSSGAMTESLSGLLEQLKEWELEVSKSRQSFLDALPAAYLSIDQNGEIREANAPLLKMLGREGESLLGTPVTGILPPESLDSFYVNTRSLFLPGDATEFETKLMRSDGARFFAELRGADIFCGKDGMPRRGIVVTDINRRKRMAGLLRDSEQRFRLLYEQHPLPYLCMDENGNISEVNHAWLELLAYSRHETIGRKLSEFQVDPGAPGVLELLHELSSVETVRGRELELRHRTGRSVAVSVSAKAVHRENGSFRQAHCVLTDITERLSMENERKRLVAAIEQAVEGVMITDLQGRIVHVNPAFEKMSGHSAAEVTGKAPGFLKSGAHDAVFYRGMWDTILRGDVWQGRVENRRKDGSRYEADLVISPIRDTGGQIVNFVAVSHDVTEKVKLEKCLRQSQKMEAIGTLAGGIAHDFNNILMALLGYAEMAKMAVEPDAKVQPYLAEILTSGERAKELVRQILTFSRQAERGLHPVKVSLIVKEVLRLLRATMPSTIKICYSINSDGLVYADPTEVHQVLMNLCTNASYAMRKRGGRLELVLDEIVLPAADAHAPAGLEPGNYIRLLVKDSGCGMGKEVLERIFEPFFTTKEAGEGTGMGLAVVHGIVTEMKGGISVESQPEMGSSLWVFMPKFAGIVETDEEGAAPLPIGGGQRILYVDDEKNLGVMVQKLLSQLGYHVTAMSNPREALAAFLLTPDGFDAVITDQTMPGLTGIQLAKELLKRRPGLPIILCTGYSELVSRDKALEMGISDFLVKPVSSKDWAFSLAGIFEAQAQEGKNKAI